MFWHNFCLSLYLFIILDSYEMDLKNKILHNLDVLIYSLVPPGDVHVKMDEPESLEYIHIVNSQANQLIEISKLFSPKCIIPNHLIDCSWAIRPCDLKNKIEEFTNENIVILEDISQIFTLE